MNVLFGQVYFLAHSEYHLYFLILVKDLLVKLFNCSILFIFDFLNFCLQENVHVSHFFRVLIKYGGSFNHVHFEHCLLKHDNPWVEFITG